MILTSDSFKHTARAPLEPAAPVVGYLHRDSALVGERVRPALGGSPAVL